MKKLLILLSLTLFMSEAFAEGYGMAGCGLGATVMGKHGGQVFAATTNGTFFNQGFGITSGTSECLEPSQMAQVEAQQQFITSNLDELSKEMAKGDGEHLKAFAQTMGCSDAVYPQFAQQMKQSYKTIFSSPGAMATLKTIRTEIKSNNELNKQCNTVI